MEHWTDPIWPPMIVFISFADHLKTEARSAKGIETTVWICASFRFDLLDDNIQDAILVSETSHNDVIVDLDRGGRNLGSRKNR